MAEQDIPPPPSQPQNEPPQPSGEETNGQSIPRLKNSRLTNKQKKELNKIRLESAMNAMAEAIGSGTAPIDAISIGKTAGDEQANLWVQVVKRKNAITRASASSGNGVAAVGAAAAVAGTPRAGESSIPPQGQTSQHTAAGAGVTNRNKLSSVAPYRRGKAVGASSSTVMRRPFSMENKCMVIQGLNRITKDQFFKFIKDTAGKEINILHVEVLSKGNSPWMTVAIELNEEDYNHLSNMDLWDQSIGIRDYVGWRFWHKMKRQEVPTEMSKVRMSWAT